MKKLLIRVGIGVGVVIASIALVVCFVPLKEVAYTVTVDYEGTETYYEDEPYEDTETYFEDEPYEDTETYYETEPLTYEVVKSYTDTDSHEERRRIVIGGVVFQDEVVEVFYPIGCVTLQNTDSVYGAFGVQFTFYALDKSDAGILGGLPDFKFEDYLAAEDPDLYLDKLDWDKLDWDKIMIFCEEYNRQENITLQPGETGTVTASVQDIEIDKMAWKWKYTIAEPTKTVEKQRTVTKYRQVEKQRTVTNYRQVEKERTVMKQRPETRYKKVSLLEYLLHY
jgi:MFS superfamily sulfate permease-like transporter